MKVMIVGDMHGRWGDLNVQINRRRPDLVLQVGDFGFFPNEAADASGGCIPKDPRPYDPNGKLKNKGIPVHWCDGNHEDHGLLQRLAGDSLSPIEVAPMVLYQPRGSTLALPDGRIVLFLGGAFSVDWRMRDDWSPLEVLAESVLNRLPKRVDIVVSHTCPASFGLQKSQSPHWDPEWDLSPDPSQRVLDEILERLSPSHWYFGHFHRRLAGETAGCRWHMLQMTPGAGYWEWLPER